MDPDQLKPVLALHRYYIWADRFRILFEGTCPELAQCPPTAEALWVHDAMLFMSYWYSSLYTVVEGWQKLQLDDPLINELLESPNVTLLRRYRNGVCHYQRQYGDPRFLDVMESQGVVPWVRELNLAFGRCLMTIIQATPGTGADEHTP